MPSAPKYDAAFWRRVLGRAKQTTLMGRLTRMVESQAQKATVALVDTLEEHDLLESMLEDSKPVPPVAKELRRFDYLLRTPWRYPPLPWGSRFGRRFEPGLFYGSLTAEALFSEAAYYRLVFLDGMERPFADRVISQHTVFDAQYRTDAGYDLTRAPFARHEKVLRHKSGYGPCQALGTELRERGAAAVTYLSARAQGPEANIALFEPSALRSRKHRNPRLAIGETTVDSVTFRVRNKLYGFEREQFLDEGRFPQPAS